MRSFLICLVCFPALLLADHVDVNPSTLDFGNRVAGTANFLTWTVTAKKTVTFESVSAGGDFVAGLGTCLGTLPADSQCTLFVRFQPSTTGLITETLTVFTTDADGEHEKHSKGKLRGTGIPVALSSISVTPNPASIALGLGQQLTAIGSFNNGTSQNLTSSATWSSANAAVATVNSSGLVRSTGQGTTSITAMSGAISGSSLVTVGPPNLVSISIQPSTATIKRGTSLQLAATGTFTDGSVQDLTSTVTWSSIQPGVATVNATGLVNAIAAGATNIQVSRNGLNGSMLVHVFAPVVTSLSVSPASFFMGVSATKQLTAAATFDDGTSGNAMGTVSWNSGNPSVATVNATGLVMCVGVGTSSISATSGAVFAAARMECPIQEVGVVMTAFRMSHTATALNDGRVLIAGGQTSFSPPFLSSFDIYSPISRTFPSGGAMRVARTRHLRSCTIRQRACLHLPDR